MCVENMCVCVHTYDIILCESRSKCDDVIKHRLYYITYFDLAGHTESDVLILFQEQENGLLRIIHLKPIHLQMEN